MHFDRRVEVTTRRVSPLTRVAPMARHVLAACVALCAFASPAAAARLPTLVVPVTVAPSDGVQHPRAGAPPAPPASMSAPTTVVPSAGLPPQVKVNRSNANLSVTRFQGRTYLVFRTAVWQIADSGAALYVVSSRDERHWRFEGSFSYGRDLREPRLLAWHGHLFLYFALLGSNPAAFQPGGLMATRLLAPGRWAAPKRILYDDFIAWSVKLHGDRPYMLGYTGGGGTYSPSPPAKKVYWLTTADGLNWQPVNPSRPVVYTGQCGETDFAFRDNGDLVTACQTEEVDALGWGAKICTAPASDTSSWTCRGDPRRLDSPFVFTVGSRVYVIARRQPNFGGNYDLHYDWLPNNDAKFATYDGAYAATTKRCALWSIDPAARTFRPLSDVPGWGDTCYPSLIARSDRRFDVYNYTTPLDGLDEPWGVALTADRTVIYRMTLSFR